MNITIFKTWHMETNTYSYWQDDLPSHDKYNLIIGQAIVPDDVQQQYSSYKDNQRFLKVCYLHIMTVYNRRKYDNE